MALITLPTKFGFSRVSRFGLTRQSNSLRSRYTAQEQRVVYPYAIWEFEGELIEYDGPEAAAIRSFFVDLEGTQNTFKLPVPGYTKPATEFQGETVTTRAAAPVRATVVLITNGTPSKTFLNKGDFVTINDELKLVTENVAFDSIGEAAIYFKPALRKPVALNTIVRIRNPYCLMRAAEDDVASWGLAPPVRQSSTFQAIEAIEI